MSKSKVCKILQNKKLGIKFWMMWNVWKPKNLRCFSSMDKNNDLFLLMLYFQNHLKIVWMRHRHVRYRLKLLNCFIFVFHVYLYKSRIEDYPRLESSSQKRKQKRKRKTKVFKGVKLKKVYILKRKTENRKYQNKSRKEVS